MVLSSNSEINKGIILDDLEAGEYIAFIRLKLNNSMEPKYYTLQNVSEYKDIEYYSVTNDEQNNKINISFKNKVHNDKNINYLSINVEESELPSNVYDIVIDAGHGGKDEGEKYKSIKESDVTLDYAKLLKTKLEDKGFKVKLTRDDNNTNTYTSTNMYDNNGRITIACSSNAKLMVSLHLNNGGSATSGVEVYCPCLCNLDFAKNLVSKITTNTEIKPSNNNLYKQAEGVYVRNFTENIIAEYKSSAEKSGYEPYNITLNTPYLYTIREVGGIATNAYVDGRNTKYSANKYYNSNKGIECYEIDMGYIKNDLDIIMNQMDQYCNAMEEAISDYINE